MTGFRDGSGISWTICKRSAPRSRQITTPTFHHSIFYRQMKQEMMGFCDGSGISWTTCKQSIPRSRQITTPTTHYSIFYRPDALPDAQTTVSIINIIINIIWCMIQQLVSLRSVCSPRLDVYFVTTICINWAAIPTTSWSWVSEAGFSEWGTTLSLDASHTTLQQSPHNQWNTHI